VKARFLWEDAQASDFHPLKLVLIEKSSQSLLVLGTESLAYDRALELLADGRESVTLVHDLV